MMVLKDAGSNATGIGVLAKLQGMATVIDARNTNFFLSGSICSSF